MVHFDGRMRITRARRAGCVPKSALGSYGPYDELSGEPASARALLEAHHSGVVLTSIVHRDQARLYVKQVHEGESEIDLSPEEQEAVNTALSAGPAKAA